MACICPKLTKWVLNTKISFCPMIFLHEKSHFPMPVCTGAIVVINFAWSQHLKFSQQEFTPVTYFNA